MNGTKARPLLRPPRLRPPTLPAPVRPDVGYLIRRAQSLATTPYQPREEVSRRRWITRFAPPRPCREIRGVPRGADSWDRQDGESLISRSLSGSGMGSHESQAVAARGGTMKGTLGLNAVRAGPPAASLYLARVAAPSIVARIRDATREPAETGS